MVKARLALAVLITALSILSLALVSLSQYSLVDNNGSYGGTNGNEDHIDIHDDIELEINYSIIDDPIILARALEIINTYSRENIIDTFQTDTLGISNITVIEVTVKLSNHGNNTVYLVTNAFCHTLCNRDWKMEPPLWVVREPAADIKFQTSQGSILSIPVLCTRDLKLKPLPPKTTLINKFYYIATTPFNATIIAETLICTKPSNNKDFCSIINESIHIEIMK
ncbi:MAG: hypothetical protein J7K21_04775 [Desulfurococcales archaeon]|nr:hypothetical protein [Desulfurococcales archaeon]